MGDTGGGVNCGANILLFSFATRSFESAAWYLVLRAACASLPSITRSSLPAMMGAER